ncbi:unnamed protein product [Symbiodinium sp. CCMP2592]|nr:unnamed protein product [Symbiodinium sp. CCMP2592]
MNQGYLKEIRGDKNRHCYWGNADLTPGDFPGPPPPPPQQQRPAGGGGAGSKGFGKGGYGGYGALGAAGGAYGGYGGYPPPGGGGYGPSEEIEVLRWHLHGPMKFHTTLCSQLQATARAGTVCNWDGSPPTLEASMCTESC